MGQCDRFGTLCVAVFHTLDTFGCCLVLCELCANGIPMGMVVGVEYRYTVAVVVDSIGAFGHYYAD